MAKRVWFIAGVTRGIGTEIAKAALVDSNQVVASDRKPEAVTKALGRYLQMKAEIKKSRSANLETATWRFRLSGSAAWE